MRASSKWERCSDDQAARSSGHRCAGREKGNKAAHGEQDGRQRKLPLKWNTIISKRRPKVARPRGDWWWLPEECSGRREGRQGTTGRLGKGSQTPVKGKSDKDKRHDTQKEKLTDTIKSKHQQSELGRNWPSITIDGNTKETKGNLCGKKQLTARKTETAGSQTTQMRVRMKTKLHWTFVHLWLRTHCLRQHSSFVRLLSNNSRGSGKISRDEFGWIRSVGGQIYWKEKHTNLLPCNNIVSTMPPPTHLYVMRENIKIGTESLFNIHFTILHICTTCLQIAAITD